MKPSKGRVALALGASMSVAVSYGGADTSGASPPAGFEQWLRTQCPDGHALRLMTEAGAEEMPCEEARERVLSSGATHELLGAYVEQMEDAAGEATTVTGERIGEAEEPGVISGLICGLIVNGLLAYQCDKVHMHWGSCFAASVPPSILCAVIPLP
jgi:hypothetical protein